MRQVDRHADVVHAPHDLLAELAQTAVGALVLPVADEALAHVGQASQADANAVQHVHPMQIGADRQVLERRQPACRASLLRIVNVLGAGDLPHGVALFVDVGQHHADLVDQVVEVAERRVRLLAQARQQVGGGDRGPAASPHRFEAPPIHVAAKVGRHLAGVVGEHHRVLVDVDQQQVVHQPLEAQLLGTVERHAHGWHAIDLCGKSELGRWHRHGGAAQCRTPYNR